MHGDMLKNMNYKRSKAPTQKQIEQGWLTDDARSVATTFKRHGLLLLLLTKLEIIPGQYFHILQRDFEQTTWSKIRDGDYDGTD